MIFVTVGAQMPFDRMVRAIDAWAGRHTCNKVFAQVGRSRYKPRHVQYSSFLEPPSFRAFMKNAGYIVSHAGMGTIITAMEMRKPIIVMPRRADLGETRSDHQIDTVNRLRGFGGIHVTDDEEEMLSKLDDITARPLPEHSNVLGCLLARFSCPFQTEECSGPMHRSPCALLTVAIRDFVDGKGPPRGHGGGLIRHPR